jgi:hypothetical protein
MELPYGAPATKSEHCLAYGIVTVFVEHHGSKHVEPTPVGLAK